MILSTLTHMTSIVDLMANDVETPRIHYEFS